MQFQPKPATIKAPAETFTGDAWIDHVVRGEAPSRMRAAHVRFAPSARNAWHAHAVGQTVHVTDGVGRIRGGGVERDVSFETPEADVADAVTGAYHAKYDRYGPGIVGSVVSAEAARSTLRVSPA